MKYSSHKQPLIHLLTTALLTLLVSACVGEKNPQEVHQAFWAAVISNDTTAAIEYSTLSSPESYNAFGKNWQSHQLQTGKVIIDNNQARIETILSLTDTNQQKTDKFTTYLIKQNETWLVDYQKTQKSMQPDAVSQLFGKLEHFSEKFSEEFESSSEDITQELNQMGEQFKDYTEELSEQASESIEKFSNQLKESIDEIERSTEKLLEDKKSEPQENQDKAGGLIKI